jgi:adenylate cyclase
MSLELAYKIGGQWMTFPVEKDEVTIGRDENNDLVIEHSTVSRRHAKLQRTGNAWRVSDLGSRHGTTVNDLGHADRELRSGDKIFLHDFPLTFVDREARGASLVSGADLAGEETLNTVFQNTVDFNSLASSRTDVVRLQTLLAVVTKASQAILVGGSLDEIFVKVLDLVFEYLPAQRGFIMLWDGERQDFVTRCVKHKSLGGSGEAPIRFSRTIAEKVYRDKVAVMTSDAQTDARFAEGASIMEQRIRSAMAAPLCHGDEVDGLIYIDTTVEAKAFDSYDLDLLSALGNHLAVAIGQSRLQASVIEQQLVRRRLERYHSPAVVERITRAREGGDALVAEERDVTVVFADVVGFTPRCENMDPRSVGELLNRYFGEMTQVIFRHEGTLDKFIGDCLMAVFGAPIATEDHQRSAVEAALDMREALDRVNEPLAEQDRLQFRVGIHSGRVIAGDIGSPMRSDYTVLGSTVNLAARLEAGVACPGQIVITETTRQALGEGYEVRDLGEHQLKGVSKAMRCYEISGRRSGADQ